MPTFMFLFFFSARGFILEKKIVMQICHYIGTLQDKKINVAFVPVIYVIRSFPFSCLYDKYKSINPETGYIDSKAEES